MGSARQVSAGNAVYAVAFLLLVAAFITTGCAQTKDVRVGALRDGRGPLDTEGVPHWHCTRRAVTMAARLR